MGSHLEQFSARDRSALQRSVAYCGAKLKMNPREHLCFGEGRSFLCVGGVWTELC